MIYALLGGGDMPKRMANGTKTGGSDVCDLRRKRRDKIYFIDVGRLHCLRLFVLDQRTERPQVTQTITYVKDSVQKTLNGIMVRR